MGYRTQGNRLLDKAQRLLESGRIERIDNDRYLVIGDHGTYTVAQSVTGAIGCNCLGYQDKRKCSHSTAVLMYINRKKRRKRRRN